MPRFNVKKHLPILAFVLLLAVSFLAYTKESIHLLDLPTYQSYLQEDRFTSAKIVGREILLKSDEGSYSILLDGVDLKKLLAHVPISMQEENLFLPDLVNFVLVLFFILGLLLFTKKDEEKKVEPKREKSNALAPHNPNFQRSHKAVNSSVKFSDVAGIESVKEELYEIVDFLKNPNKYKSFGIKLPRGVLLIGPPGVGKTLIAKAVAGEANVPFFYQSGASFVQIYVGMGAKRVRELFTIAKAQAPSIIFIDEIDALGRSRVGSHNDERDATLNQLLTEMDGFEESNNVMVIAATNQLDVLDDALLRSGRFDRRLFISLPNIQEREDILKVYLLDKTHDVHYHDIAKMTVGFSGAALATLVNEAAIHALNSDATKITKEDFLAVKEKVLLGKKSLLSYSEDERKIQAIYQASKALAAHWYEIDFDKISMIGSHFKEVDREIESRSQMLSKIKLYLSGMIATNLFYDETFSNAREDLSKAKRLSQEMVEEYGMGEGIFATTMDASEILEEAIEDTQGFLFKMKDAIEVISQELLEKETVSKKRLREMIDEFL